jgi:hypothetical protein
VPPAVHKIRASECGNAKIAERFTTAWADTTCPTCLRHLPAPLRVPTAPIRRCVDGRCEDAGGAEQMYVRDHYQGQGLAAATSSRRKRVPRSSRQRFALCLLDVG